MFRLFAFLPALLLLASCSAQDEGPLTIAWIGTEEDLLVDGLRLSEGAQHLRAATHSGLVSLDPQGEVLPGLAERWIVTEDGLSYIFRLRQGDWPDGTEMTSNSVRQALRRTIRNLRGTTLALDLSPIDEIRSMTGRVIEIRLVTPVPDLLTLLAQPELALRHGDGGTGPMVLDSSGLPGSLTLKFKPPLERGLPENPDWQDDVREIALLPRSGADAIALFDDNAVELVMGGRIDDFPLVDTGPLSRGTVQIDATYGLFGLRVRRAEGLLADQRGREALALALDRPALMARYNLGGWTPTTRLVTPGLPGDPGLVTERWGDLSIEDRRIAAAARVQQWLASAAGEQAGSARLTIAMGVGPGLDLLFADLAAQFQTIGVTLERAESASRADLELMDRTARYADPRWFLNQFACSLDLGLCDEDADFLLDEAQEASDPTQRANLLAQAEAQLTRTNAYIPIGAPLRWSLVRSGNSAFFPNAFGFHPLPPMAQIPN